MKNVLVLGGTGLVGQYLIDRFANAGYSVDAVSRNKSWLSIPLPQTSTYPSSKAFKDLGCKAMHPFLEVCVRLKENVKAS